MESSLVHIDFKLGRLQLSEISLITPHWSYFSSLEVTPTSLLCLLLSPLHWLSDHPELSLLRTYHRFLRSFAIKVWNYLICLQVVWRKAFQKHKIYLTRISLEVAIKEVLSSLLLFHPLHKYQEGHSKQSKLTLLANHLHRYAESLN